MKAERRIMRMCAIGCAICLVLLTGELVFAAVGWFTLDGLFFASLEAFLSIWFKSRYDLHRQAWLDMEGFGI